MLRCFNPRARTGRDVAALFRLENCCFNPRARMGRDLTRSKLRGNGPRMFQSTRPHGRDDRRSRRSRSCQSTVSIHAPAWGATNAIRDARSETFQSTRPQGATSPIATSQLAQVFQSTRPARGATKVASSALNSFQSTRPQGARPYRLHVTIMSFNPRARMGRATARCITAYCGIVSIHAPARGATATA